MALYRPVLRLWSRRGSWWCCMTGRRSLLLSCWLLASSAWGFCGTEGTERPVSSSKERLTQQLQIVSSLRSTFQQLRETLTQLETALQSATAESQTLNSSLQRLSSEVQTLRTQSSALQTQLGAASTSLEEEKKLSTSLNVSLQQASKLNRTVENRARLSVWLGSLGWALAAVVGVAYVLGG